MEILKIQNLSKSYLINSDRKNEVLKDVNLIVDENDYIAIVGASGAGKSTLLNVILGFLNYDEGSVQVFSKEVIRHGRTPSTKQCEKFVWRRNQKINDSKGVN